MKTVSFPISNFSHQNYYLVKYGLIILIIFSLSSLFTGCTNKINKNETETAKGIVYTASDMKPVNGKVIEYLGQSESTIISETAYTDGIKNGSDISYFEDGKIKLKSNYVKGILSGDYEVFNEKGRLLFKATFDGNKDFALGKSFNLEDTLDVILITNEIAVFQLIDNLFGKPASEVTNLIGNGERVTLEFKAANSYHIKLIDNNYIREEKISVLRNIYTFIDPVSQKVSTIFYEYPHIIYDPSDAYFDYFLKAGYEQNKQNKYTLGNSAIDRMSYKISNFNLITSCYVFYHFDSTIFSYGGEL